MARDFPSHPAVPQLRANLAYVQGHVDSAEATIREAYQRGSDAVRPDFAAALGGFALLQGRAREAERLSAEAWCARSQRGIAPALVAKKLDDAWRELWLLDRRDRAVHIADSLLSVGRVDTLPLADRPYAFLMSIYAAAGRADRARALLADVERQVSGTTDTLVATDRHFVRGLLAQAERRYTDAAREIRVAGLLDGCGGCTRAWQLGYVYDLADNPDSAIAAYTRYIDGPARPVYDDAYFLAGTHKRLGELWEARGDARKAASHYAKFVELWKNADPELQPGVREARQRLERLSRTEAR